MQGARILGDNIAAHDWAQSVRSGGMQIGVTNGCFDVLHAGHVDHLLAAKEMAVTRGCLLLVAVNSDASVRRLKGPTRPINTLQARVRVLAALRYVDAVTVFHEDTPERLIQLLQPRLLVKSSDYEGKTIVGADFVKSIGGEVLLTPFTSGYSTSRILEKGGTGDVRTTDRTD